MTKEEIIDAMRAAFSGSGDIPTKDKFMMLFWIEKIFLPAFELEGLVIVDKEEYEKMCVDRDMHQKMGDDWWADYKRYKRNCHHDDDANQ